MCLRLWGPIRLPGTNLVLVAIPITIFGLVGDGAVVLIALFPVPALPPMMSVGLIIFTLRTIAVSMSVMSR